MLSSGTDSAETREKKRRRRSRWGSDVPQPSPVSVPVPAPGPVSLPGQPPVGFSPAGMTGYPPPVPPVGLRPPGLTMNPQLGAATPVPRPNMPGTGSKCWHISFISHSLCPRLFPFTFGSHFTCDFGQSVQIYCIHCL